MNPWQWFRNVSAAVWGDLDLDTQRDAQRGWLIAKGHVEKLTNELTYQTKRADLAAKMLEDAEKSRREASDALGKNLIKQIEGKV